MCIEVADLELVVHSEVSHLAQKKFGCAVM
jgi:hypothetical protein